MTPIDYQKIAFSEKEAADIALKYYGKKGHIQRLAGEVDFNFKITNPSVGESFILKISRPDANADAFDFQVKILEYLSSQVADFVHPTLIHSITKKTAIEVADAHGQVRYVRMLRWVNGRLWSNTNPQTDNLRYSLGEKCGQITALLRGFDHPAAHRFFEWDIAQAAWALEYLHLFNEEQKATIAFFYHQFETIQPQYAALRKSVIHNDANDNNIIVSDNLLSPTVETIIDYGDAIYTQTINDLAVAIAYAVMDKPDPLAAALPIVAGYHKTYPLQAAELAVLPILVAMRLVISVTKSAINKQREPENTYLLISEKPAWQLLYQWQKIPTAYSHFAFREACGFEPVPTFSAFKKWTDERSFSLKSLFPTLPYERVEPLDLSIGSTFLGNFSEYQNDLIFTSKIVQQQAAYPNAFLAGGYLEPRPFYSTSAYEKEGNDGPEYRTIHLGLDVWAAAGTPVHAFMAGEVFSFADNKGDKDYGPTIILKHSVEISPKIASDTEGGRFEFYSLYGHLSLNSLNDIFIGKKIPEGACIGYLGNNSENGNWSPHLHFQIMLDMLGYTSDFAGVAFPNQKAVWSKICPNPNFLFKNPELARTETGETDADLIQYRRAHLGKSLSLSYSEPLRILRGERQYLIDATGRRYLDTVNNVAHVGHEHPSVVRAGQAQMAVLNTNTRYLSEPILDFAKALLATFPPELSVVHFVNSGSEANELALRMAQAVTNQRDMIALEIGYHGNTNGCIAVSSYKFDGKGGKGKPEHTHIVPLPDSFRGKYQGSLSETGALYAAHVAEAIENIHRKGRGVAAFIAESIVSCGGQIELPDDYLRLAYAAVRAAGGVCIADEVQVGFGRVGKAFWGFELQGVVPDIVTLGKPIGNGHPLGAVVCTRAVADAFANGMEYFNTFGGNPVSCAIGLEVLNVIKKENLQENALTVGEYLKDQLRLLQNRFPLIGDVRGQGLFLGFELVEQGKIPATAKTAYLADRMKAHGILMSVDGPQNNVIKIKPPLSFSIANADRMLFYLEKILSEDFIMAR